MNNEPVALTQVEIMNALTLGVPLYTHPVKEHFEDEPQAEELHEIMQSNAELTPCEELRAFQEQQNGVFSDHNACCYRHECRIVWNDWEKLRSNPAELTDEEVFNLEQQAYNLAMQVQNQKAEIEALKEKLNEAIDAEKDRRFE